MTWGAALVASLFATLCRPRWWLLALAGFLVRGGLLVLLMPVVDVPSAAGLANLLGPIVVGFAFGNTPPAIVLLVGWAAVGALAWLAASTILGAWFELTLAREALADEELEGVARPPIDSVTRSAGPAGERPRVLGRAVAARLLAHVPTMAALAIGALRIGEATYAELIAPGDGTLPVALRVILRVPETVLILVTVWLVGEAVGGYAVRRIAAGIPLASAMRMAIRGVLGRAGGLATLVTTTLTTAAAGAAVVVALAQVWVLLRIAIIDDSSPFAILGAIWVLTATWLAGLWLLSLAAAWRSAAWSFEVFRRDP